MKYTGNVGDYGMAGKARGARLKHAQGWSIEELARFYGVPSSIITAVLSSRRYRRPRFSRALNPAEKQRRAEERTQQREAAKAKAQASRWLVDAAEIPAADLKPPAPEPWDGPTDWRWHGPRKITPEVLTRAIELHNVGMSWPAIAREIGCHRMTLYFALRR